MKRILFLFSILFFVCFGVQKSFAQGNLQFNRVINYVIPSQTASSNQTGPNPQINGTLTVPANKVWKVESASCKNVYSPTWGLTLDNYLLFTFGVYSSSLNYYWKTAFPIWLPAGTYNWQGTYYVNTYPYNASFEGASISIIEFNIVP